MPLVAQTLARDRVFVRGLAAAWEHVGGGRLERVGDGLVDAHRSASHPLCFPRFVTESDAC
jgi:hypothetical protein